MFKEIKSSKIFYKSYTTAEAYTVAILILSLLFAISIKFSRTSKTVVIYSLCCFLFLNYVKKIGLLRVTRLMSKASISFCRTE